MRGSPWLCIPPVKTGAPCSVVANPSKPRCKHRGFAFMEIPVAFAMNYFIMKTIATAMERQFCSWQFVRSIHYFYEIVLVLPNQCSGGKYDETPQAVSGNTLQPLVFVLSVANCEATFRNARPGSRPSPGWTHSAAQRLDTRAGR